MFGWLGRTVVRHPWWTIGAWLIGAVLIIALSPSGSTRSDQSDFLPSKYESVQASHLADSAFPGANQKTTPADVVIKRADGKPLTGADRQKIAEMANQIQAKKIPDILSVSTGPDKLAKDHSIQLIEAQQATSFGDQKLEKRNEDAVKTLRTSVAGLIGGTDLKYGVTGDMATQVDNQKSQDDSMKLVGIATIALIIILILAIFRSPIAAFLPIIVVAFVAEVSNKLIGVVGKLAHLNFDSGNSIIMLVVLYGIGTDYILFLLFRYRERLRAGEDKKTAMITTVQRVGEAIASAAGAVIVAFLVLLLATFKSFGSLGPQLATGVAVMLITALTLVPAVVSLLGRGVFWPSKSWKKQPKGKVWGRLGNGIGRRPVIAVIGSGVVLLGLAAAALGFKADYDFNASFPQTTESAKAMKDIQKTFPAGTLTPTEVMLKSDHPLKKAELSRYEQALKSAPGVGQVVTPVQLNGDHSVAKIKLYLNLNPNSNAAIDLVKGPLRDAVHQAAPPGTKALVGGQTAAFADINTVNNRDLSVILPVAVLLIAVILALLLRALVAPIYLVVAVLLGFAATLGATVTLFQGIEGKPGLMFMIPMIVYLFVLAIGTDYNILMIARLREEAREGHPPHRAASLAVQHAGPTIAAAGIILAGTFATLALSPITTTAEIGFGVAIGIVLSAFVVSMFFVPALTSMIGQRAWWPGHGADAKRAQEPAPNPYELAGRRY